MPASAALTDRQARTMLDVLMHYVRPVDRRTLMLECPAAYNAYCGRTVVEVIHTSDGRKV